MLRKIIKSKIFKVVSVFTAYSVILQIMAPAAWALTSGPTQPEAGTFQQASVSQMVDLFSGDFNYNLPLITVPGPNGGYPINLTYNSNITMEQEASWVGLGWNVNTGVINRTMRGLPDDFNGNDVKKTLYTRPSRTYGLEVGKSKADPKNTEIFGLDLSKVDMSRSNGGNVKIYWDSYAGLGMKTTGTAGLNAEKGGYNLTPKLDLGFDTRQGLGLTPSLHYGKRGGSDYSVGLAINSKQGLQDVYLNASIKGYRNTASQKELEVWDYNAMNAFGSATMSFASASYVPGLEADKRGQAFSVDFKNGIQTDAVSNDFKIRGFYNEQEYLDTITTRSAYGYLYSDQANSSDEEDLLDFNREKDGPVNKHAKALPVPVCTHDVFAIKGQGVGGTFRAYRNDVAVFHDPAVESRTTGYEIGIDRSEGNGVRVGVNPALSFSKAYSGNWKSKAKAVTNKYGFTGKTSNSVTEPVYFKTLGELTSDNYNGEAPYSSAPVQVEIAQSEDTDSDDGEGRSFAVKTRPFLKEKNGSKVALNNADRSERHVRTQHVSYLTRSQLNSMSKKLRDENRNVIEDYDGTISNNGSHNVEDHIGEFTVTNPDGTAYKYGLPAYNFHQREVSFALPEATSLASIRSKWVGYSSGDDGVRNGNGVDEYYSRTDIPPYAHSFYLTELQGADYADLDDTLGVSNGDAGYWVKFNYDRAYDENSVFKWRIPFQEDTANFIPRNLSDPRDNRASYTYGEKEIIYTESIETKTHIARFYSSARNDGAGVVNADGGIDITAKLQRLDSIKLFNKNDNSYAIKTVHFGYASTQLCGGVPNSVSSGGKLTLEKVWFTYGDNVKGSLSPYEFTYHGTNEAYAALKQDRWGEYQDDDPSSTPFLSNLDNPYVNQKHNDIDGGLTEAQRDTSASMWRLTSISLPSGGEINIEYQMDDYAYVQNKRAMQMCRIVDTGEDDVALTKGDGKIRSRHTLLYFELSEPIDTTSATAKDELKEYISGLQNERIFFKAYTKLHATPEGYGTNPTEVSSDGEAYDYVEGYCKLDVNLTSEQGYGFDEDNANHKTAAGDQYKIAYVRVETEAMKDKGVSANQLHPFRKAALQYLRMQRSDLFQQPNTSGGNFLSIHPFVQVLQLFKEVGRMVTGWYNFAIMSGMANELNLSAANFKPSFIRLNSPDYIKYGGGSRVSKITISDQWNTISGLSDATDYDYGQEYTYRLKDGKSSGVAEYEPLVGGEENPFRKPIRFSSDRFLAKDKALYVEEPYNESLFPSANVGYSRVVVSNLERTDGNNEPVTKDTQGYQVHEFYTAKEFPVEARATEVAHEPFWLVVPLPFIGGINVKNDGYSQGYSIELNNMHGKKKAESTYSYGSDESDVATAKTEYFYKTTRTYNPNGNNYLSSTVNTFEGDGDDSSDELGKTVDFCVDFRENRSNSKGFGLNINVTVIGPIVFPLGIPNFDYSENVFRSVVTNKVIHRTGILDKVRTTKEGAVVVAENLHYDPNTGQPILTSLTNNFEAPVYSYNFPSHWYYDGMEAAYQDQGMCVEDSTGIKTYCTPGAMLRRWSDGDRFWVEQVSPYMILRDTTDASVTVTSGTKFDVVRSGHRNQQGIVVGNIESLSNPATDRYYPLFSNPHHTNEGFNAKTFYDFDGDNGMENSGFDYILCNGDTVEINNIEFEDIGLAGGSDKVHLWQGYGGEGECKTTLTFADGALTDTTAASGYTVPVHIDSMNLVLLGNGQVQATDGNSSATGTVSFLEGCEQRSCLDNVLNAFANKMKHDWDLDYADADAVVSDATADGNDYRYGQYGIWRLSESHLYKVRRKQRSGTRIAVDGTFKHFTIFDWAGNPNPDWTRHNTITQYSPYSFELENSNAIYTKSAALYGYDNSLVTAVGNNTPYYELAFDGFEDYSGSYPSSGRGHGHLKFTATSTPTLSSSEAHTGSYSMQATQGNDLTFTGGSSSYFAPVSGEEYYFSCWVKHDDGDTAQVLLNNGTTTDTLSTSPTDEILDGWRRLEGQYTGGGSFTLTLKSVVSSSTVYFDDIRIQPFVSTMKSFVYDPNTHWLKAELDDRNYATFYNYDEQGHLIQVKKETSNGVVTMKMDRMMVRQPY